MLPAPPPAPAANRLGFSSFVVLLTLAITGVHAPGQAPHPLTAADRARVDAIVQKMTPEEKLAYIGGTGFAVRAMPALQLPALEMSDGPVGVRSNSGLPSATYAAGIGLAATWDRALASEVGKSIGRDGRARGVMYQLGPGTNIYRSPRNGRNFEYFGEDPYLAGEMVVGYITGLQTEGVSATVKHFDANNSEFLRHDSDSVIDERTLHEVYLPAFESAVKRGHVGAVMDSYNLINGEHATQNTFLNIDVLRKDWGFSGTLMSDWNATYDAVEAANGGLDLEMPTGKFMNSANLTPALQSGAVTQATIDLKIRHILDTAAMFGWLDRTQRDLKISFLDPDSDKTALESARESAVLLKNSGDLLPLDRTTLKTVLVVGPAAYPGAPAGGGSAAVTPFHTVSLLEGVSTIAKGVNVLYDPGLPTLRELAEHTEWSTAATEGQPGVIVETFDTKDLSGTPSLQTTASHINTDGIPREDVDRRQPTHPVSHRYTAFYNAAAAGDYLIAMAGDVENTGNRVTVDGQLVIDDWRYVRAVEPHLTLPLTAGPHKVVVETWKSSPTGGRTRLAILPEASVVNEHAKQLAAQADAVVVATGFQSDRDPSEAEAGDRTFDLPFGQDALIRAMAAANPKTIVTVTSGGNVDSTTWIDKTPALIEGWYGGQAGGQALAEILFGDINPSGHLPATFERRAEDNPTFNNYYPPAGEDTSANPRVFYKEGIFVGYRGYEQKGTTPLFPFGFGLSYTTFQFSNLQVTRGGGNGADGTATLATAAFDITNTGSRSGAAVAQVYVTDTHAKFPRPKHELKGFERIELAPKETKHLVVPLNFRSFAYWDGKLKRWAVDPGRFTISVGDSVASLPLTGEVEISPEAAMNRP